MTALRYAQHGPGMSKFRSRGLVFSNQPDIEPPHQLNAPDPGNQQQIHRTQLL